MNGRERVSIPGRPMPNERTSPLPSDAGEFALLSEEMAIFLVRFGPRLAASRHGISERTLRRRFERRGLRLADHMKESRLRLAERLLLTDLPLTTVSDRLGFGSPQTFARFMRREFGETASSVRRRLKVGS
jgi:AraC-like DNA-binding protein